MPAWFLAHPWMTLFLGFAAIDGVVTLVRGYNPMVVNSLGNTPAAPPSPAPPSAIAPVTTSGALPWGYLYALPALGARALAAKVPTAQRGGVPTRAPGPTRGPSATRAPGPTRFPGPTHFPGAMRAPGYWPVNG